LSTPTYFVKHPIKAFCKKTKGNPKKAEKKGKGEDGGERRAERGGGPDLWGTLVSLREDDRPSERRRPIGKEE